MRNFFITLTRNAISLIGATMTTVSAVLIVTLFAIELIGFVGNPYVGIIAYLVLPAFFVLGLILIPIGIVRERRRERQAAAEKPTFPVIDLNQTRMRRSVIVFLVLSAVNLIVVTTVMFKAVEVMETNEFCGETCHTVMQPEYTAHRGSPHSRVSCVDCHIGPGADWFVKSKLSGAWQVVSVTFDLYPRPIPSPVHDLRPARETCEQCHWPTKFVGNRPRVITRHKDDEANTALKTVLMLKIGGMAGDEAHGIHWHVDPGNRIRYRSDASRETIHEVEMTRADGTTKRFLSPDAAEANGDAEDAGEWRTMDCVDCHNRPTHIYRLPEQEVDNAIATGRIAADLPFVRREAVRILRETYASHEEALAEIPPALVGFYEREFAELAAARRSEIEAAGRLLADAYCRNVFPRMNVTWGTYPDHIGHERAPGCFRCHTDEHSTTDGEVISQDCELCHNVLAWDEEDPEVLSIVQQ